MDRRDFLQTTAALSLASTALTSANAQTNTERLSGSDALTQQLNPKIQDAREVALSILQPNDKTLQHGLDLHADSLVFDTYGFSPRAAIDGDRMKELVEEGASDIEVKDLREEMSMTRYVTDPIEQAEYLAAWRASGVTCIFQNAGEEGQDPLRLVKRLARFTYATDMLKDYVPKAAVPDDIIAAKEAGRHCLYFTGNGVPLTQQWVSVEDELRYL
ncbi:MAG: dipeptidase, partial [Planctomycetaceae bacterium]|nr:dipeptidase [Planctomycetaceae bacterium]